MKPLLCLLGFHDDEVRFDAGNRLARCNRCGRVEITEVRP